MWQLIKNKDVKKHVELFSMWEQRVSFVNGWFVYSDDKGYNSIISQKCAKYLEFGYQKYQATMDIERGGRETEAAFSSRGFVKTGKGQFGGEYELAKYQADQFSPLQINELSGVLQIPDKVGRFAINTVSQNAFMGCNDLRKVILPKAVDSIGAKAFADCSALEEVVFGNDNVKVGKDAFAGTKLVSKSKTTGTEIIGKTLIHVDVDCEGEFVVPSGVTSIADFAFKGCEKLTSIIVHDEVRNIGAGAFEDCKKLRAIRLPNEVDMLGNNAFKNCLALIMVKIPNGVKIVNHFKGCLKLEDVYIPETVEKIDYRCFEETKLLTEYFNSNEKALYLGKWLIAFRPDSEGKLVIREGTVGIADQPWDIMGKKKLGDYKELKEIVFPTELRIIGQNAFSYSSVQELDLPQGLKMINDAAFRGTMVSNVTIPSSVEHMGTWSLMDCERLETVTFEGNPSIGDFAIVDRRDKRSIFLYGAKGSNVEEYVNHFGKNYSLKFGER